MAHKTHHHEKTGHFLPKHAVQGFKAQHHPPAPSPIAQPDPAPTAPPAPTPKP